MSGPFPMTVTAADGIGVLDGLATFPDADNHPAPGLPFKPAAGDDLVLLEDSDGNHLLSGGDDAGGVGMQSVDGLSLINTSSAGAVLTSASSSVAVSPAGTKVTGDVGFFGANPIAQPAAPTDTASIIAALKALGLVAS